jgi:SAM-dependent methyltransferase
MVRKVDRAMSAVRMAVRKLVPASWRPTLGDWRRKIVFSQQRVNRQKQQLLASGDLDARQQELLKKASARIHYRDGMYDGHGERYFKVGLSAIECVENTLSQVASFPIQSALDLPSGYGRVLRFLVQRFPEAKLTACDIEPGAVDFCAREFSAIPVVSQQNVKRVGFDNKFDLIWCGSLVTHLNHEAIRDLLTMFAGNLNPHGIMIFTTHGDRAIDRLKANEAFYGLRRQDLPPLIEGYQKAGYGFVDYSRDQGYFDFHAEKSSYGVSLTSPGWIRAQAQDIGGLREIYFNPHGWDEHQDVYAFQKVGS